MLSRHGVAVADVVKALALVVQIVPAWVRVPAVAEQRKWTLGKTPAHYNVPH